MKFTITLISILFSSSLLFGQILERTERKAVNKTNQRIDNKIDQGLNKGLDAVEGVFKKKSKDNSKKEANTETPDNTAETQKAMSIFGSSADVEDKYDFDHNMLLNVETYDKKGKKQDPIDMKMFFSDDEPTFGMEMEMEGSKSFIIYDMKTYQMVSLIENDGQKFGTAMKFNQNMISEIEKGVAEEEAKSPTYKFTKTGNSKVISGFNCDEYKVESSEANPDWEATYWITDETEANWIKYMGNMAAVNKNVANQMSMPEDYPSGTMIQMINQSKKNQEKSIMTVKEFNKNQGKSFSTAGYQFMNIPGMGGK